MSVWQTLRENTANLSPNIMLTMGELTAYDPATHTAKFNLVLFPDLVADPTGATYVETSFLPLATPMTGPGYGAQFTPCIGGQALVFLAGGQSQLPIAALFLFNNVETPPFPSGEQTGGWQDASGASHTTTKSGATPGDGAGGAKVGGNEYAIISTVAGHFTSYDTIAQLIQTKTVGGLHTIHSDGTSEISHIAPNVGLGDKIANLVAGGSVNPAASNAVHRLQDTYAFEGSLYTKRLDDLTKLVQALFTSGAITVSVATVLADLATLVHVPLPGCSGTVLAK